LTPREQAALSPSDAALYQSSGFRDGKVPDLSDRGGVIPGVDPEQKDNVDVKVSSEEAILPRKSTHALGQLLNQTTGENLPEFIERTNGKAPAGLRAGGGYASGLFDGITPENKPKLGWNTQEEFEQDPMVQAGMGAGSIKAVTSVGKSALAGGQKLASGAWGKVKNAFAGVGDDAATASTNSVKQGFRRDASGVITKNPGLASQLRTSVNSHPVIAGGAALAAGGGAATSIYDDLGGSATPSKKTVVPDQQAQAQAAEQAKQAATMDQEAYQALGTGSQGTGDLYTAEGRAAIGRGQNKWLGAQPGMVGADLAQPKLSYQQADQLSQQTGGKGGFEAGQQRRLQYGDNAEIYGTSNRKDGKLNNFTGIGDGTTWEQRNPQAHQEALQRAASEKAGLQASIMARASSGDKGDFDFAMRQAAGLPGMAQAVQDAHQQAGLKAAAMVRDPAGVYKEQMRAQGLGAERQAAAQLAHQDRQERLAIQKGNQDIARMSAEGAAEERKAARGDKKLEQMDKHLEQYALDPKTDKVDPDKFRDAQKWVGMAAQLQGVAPENLSREQLMDAMHKLGNKGSKSSSALWDFLSMNPAPEDSSPQDMVIVGDGPRDWLHGRTLKQANGKIIPASSNQGGGGMLWGKTPINKSQVILDERERGGR